MSENTEKHRIQGILSRKCLKKGERSWRKMELTKKMREETHTIFSSHNIHKAWLKYRKVESQRTSQDTQLDQNGYTRDIFGKYNKTWEFIAINRIHTLQRQRAFCLFFYCLWEAVEMAITRLLLLFTPFDVIL